MTFTEVAEAIRKEAYREYTVVPLSSKLRADTLVLLAEKLDRYADSINHDFFRLLDKWIDVVLGKKEE